MSKLDRKANSRTVLPRPQKNRRKFLTYWSKTQQRRFERNFRKLKGKPVKFVARGLAIGVFAGCFPFFGLQSLIGVLLATILSGSKLAAIAGTWISNPLTYVPLFVFNFKVGKLLLGVETISSKEINFESLAYFMELGSTFATVLLVGCCVVGAIAAIISYFISLSVFRRLQRNKYQRRKKQSNLKKKTLINIPK